MISITGERPARDRGGAPAAMTLVEILVVLGIIGLILSIAVPGLGTYANKARMKSATREIVGLVGLARSVAISSHEDHAVIVDAERKTVSVENLKTGKTLERVVSLPSALTVEVQVAGEPAAESRVVFRPTGSLNGRTTSIVLADRDQRHTITVSSITGSVTAD